MSRVTKDADPQALTEAGWPRPRFDGWPVPWVSPQGELSTMNDGRYQACASGALCAVCGEGFALNERAVALIKVEPDQPIDPETWQDGQLLPMDNAVMHPRCARLAYSTCPALLRLRQARELLPVDVPANAAYVEISDDGDDSQPRARAVLDAAGCQPLPLPETEWPT